jgi:hypothetical protein
MSAPRRRKKYPPLRLVENPRLLEPIGFREHALQQFAHWTNRPRVGEVNTDSIHFYRLWCAWHRARGTEIAMYNEPNFDELASAVYDANEAREGARARYPRLATLNGARVQA